MGLSGTMRRTPSTSCAIPRFWSDHFSQWTRSCDIRRRPMTAVSRSNPGEWCCVALACIQFHRLRTDNSRRRADSFSTRSDCSSCRLLWRLCLFLSQDTYLGGFLDVRASMTTWPIARLAGVTILGPSWLNAAPSLRSGNRRDCSSRRFVLRNFASCASCRSSSPPCRRSSR